MINNIYNKTIKKNKGFTLVELLIVIGLTGFAIGITADILLSVNMNPGLVRYKLSNQ